MEEEPAVVRCAHTVRGAGGAFGVGVGGSRGLLGCAELSHRAAQLEEEQNTRDHREAGCECGRHRICARC